MAYKLSDKVVDMVTTRLVGKITLGLDCSWQSVDRWFRLNQPDGPLTKKTSIEIIARETGLSEDEILEFVDINQEENS